jgi:hypothetical protein
LRRLPFDRGQGRHGRPAARWHWRTRPDRLLETSSIPAATSIARSA